MPSSPQVPAGIGSADWLGMCREAARRLELVLAHHPTTAQRARHAGRGQGGDRSLVIDVAAEDGVLALLEELHAGGERFTLVSEERGEVDFGGGPVRVVVDPIDGSLNAKRRLAPHAISIAVADGPTMADVAFGYVFEYGTGEEWVAYRGGGATLDGEPLDPSACERRDEAGRLELVGIESADPRWLAGSIDGLVERAHRLRALGSIAVTLCQVAATRLDAMLSLRRCRGFDAAAGQLIAREAGGIVAFPACDDDLGALLDLAPRSPVVAARSPGALEEMRALAG